MIKGYLLAIIVLSHTYSNTYTNRHTARLTHTHKHRHTDGHTQSTRLSPCVVTFTLNLNEVE